GTGILPVGPAGVPPVDGFRECHRRQAGCPPAPRAGRPCHGCALRARTFPFMKFTDLFIRRPVVATVVNLVILFAGLQSYKALTVRQYPKSDIAVIEVKTRYVGANAD